MKNIFIKDKTILLMALPMESQGLIEQAGFTVHYTGIGKVNAAFKTTQLILETGCTEILNLGSAGSSKLPTHSFVEVSSFVQRDMDISPLGFPIGETPMEEDPRWKGALPGTNKFPDLKKGICGTGDSFETGAPKVPCDLVDMEAYAMAKVCAKLNVGFTSLKYITDGADHDAHKDWSANLKKGAELFVSFLKKNY